MTTTTDLDAAGITTDAELLANIGDELATMTHDEQLVAIVAAIARTRAQLVELRRSLAAEVRTRCLVIVDDENVEMAAIEEDGGMWARRLTVTEDVDHQRAVTVVAPADVTLERRPLDSEAVASSIKLGARVGGAEVEVKHANLWAVMTVDSDGDAEGVCADVRVFADDGSGVEPQALMIHGAPRSDDAIRS